MAAIPTDVFFATIPELNARLKAKEFSAEELARAFSERLQQLGRATTRWRCPPAGSAAAGEGCR